MTLGKLFLVALFHLCNTRNGYCVTLVYWDFALIYEDARHNCLSNGSEMVKMDSEKQLTKVVRFAAEYNADFWIDLRIDTTKLPEYQYIYEDGDNATYFDWADGEPDRQDTDHCVRVSHVGWKFRTTHCRNKQHFFVCETDESQTDSTTITNWNTYTTEEIQTTGNRPTTEKATSPGFSKAFCICVCNETRNQNVSVDTRLKEIRSALHLDRKGLSRHKGSLVCAEDKRESSTTLGLAGASAIVFMFSLVIIGDVISILKLIANSISGQLRSAKS